MPADSAQLTDRPMPPPSDWLSWEFWAEATHAVLSGTGGLIASIWAGYATNRENIISLATFVGGAIGFWWVIKRTRASEKTAEAAFKQAETAAKRHEEQTSADRERRITESFAKAGEQLGSEKLETRLVGIYTLERISKEKESEREYWPIMETLTAYVREHAPWPPRQALANPFVELQDSSAGERAGESTSAEKPENATEQVGIQVEPATDIQAILTVLGRRDAMSRQQDKAAGRRLDLMATDLRGVIPRGSAPGRRRPRGSAPGRRPPFGCASSQKPPTSGMCT